jgi:hypothetical protein
MDGHDFDFEKIVKHLDIDDGPRGDHKDKLRWEMLCQFNASQERTPTDGFARFGRTVMQSKIMRCAVAAVIIMGAVFAFNVFDRTGNVAWAEVVNRIEQVRTFIFQHHLTITEAETEAEKEKETRVESTVYGSTEHGWRYEQEIAGKVKVIKYISPADKAVIEVIPVMKKYNRGHMSDGQIKEFLQLSDPREMIKKFMSLTYSELGQDVIDGATVEGIEIDDPKLGAGAFEECVGRLWISTATNLPVRIEFEGYSSGGQTRIQVLADAFDWNPGLEASHFEPDIPKDYSLLADVNISDNDEEILIKGLRDFADLTGKYPSQLAVLTASKEIRPGLLAQRLAAGVPLDAQITRAETEKAVSIQASCLFYARLVKEDCDVAYYGEEVTPVFPDAVLMRWKTDEGLYRIVFGDLRMETVSAAALEKLESLPLHRAPEAIEPEPADGATVSPTGKLGLDWRPGMDAVEHRLYFGTDPQDMKLYASLTEPRVDQLPELEAGRTYFWRIDEVFADDSRVRGQRWSFSTGSLIGQWKLEEGQGGRAFDTSGQGHDATIMGNARWARDRGIEFDGVDDYVDIDATSELAVSGPITVMAWIQVRQFDRDWQVIIAKGDTSWRLSRDQGDNLHFACTGLAPEWLHGKAQVNDGQWHHVAGVWDGTSIYLYVDGQLDASLPTIGRLKGNDEPVRIGDNSEEPERKWNGAIADVRVYSYALSGDEITQIFAARASTGL